MQRKSIVMTSFTSHQLLLLNILVCSILNLAGDIKAHTFEPPNYDDIDISMTKTVVRIINFCSAAK